MLKGDHGFTLVELLVIIAIVTTKAAVVVPGLHKARCAAQAKCAIETLWTLVGAQTDYNNNALPHRFAPDFATLCSGAGGGGVSFISGTLCSGKKCGYDFTMTVSGTKIINGTRINDEFAITAVPSQGSRCGTAFFIDRSGVVRKSTTGAVSASSPKVTDSDLDNYAGAPPPSPNLSNPPSVGSDAEDAAATTGSTNQAAYDALTELANLGSDNLLDQARALLQQHGNDPFLSALDGNGDGAISFDELLSTEDLMFQVRGIVESTVGHDESEELADEGVVLEVVSRYLSQLFDLMDLGACKDCSSITAPIGDMMGDAPGFLESVSEASTAIQ